MYYPYLRGRQAELLALRDLIKAGRWKKNVIPIIEPVKLSPTLRLTIKAFEGKASIAVILNPAVGDLQNSDFDKLNNNLELTSNASVMPAALLTDSYARTMNDIAAHDWNMVGRDTLAIIPENRQSEIDADGIIPALKELPATCVAYAKEMDIRDAVIDTLEGSGVRANLIRIGDPFIKRGSNALYRAHEDEFFSRDHLRYRRSGDYGFGDFSIIGADFTNGGFAPKAVAIHIVYFNEKEDLNIHHFVSNTNVDITDPAGKYAEALEKLIAWEHSHSQKTLAFDIFKQHHEQGTYPGLPMIKRLSLMHHLELVDSWLDER